MGLNFCWTFTQFCTEIAIFIVLVNGHYAINKKCVTRWFGSDKTVAVKPVVTCISTFDFSDPCSTNKDVNFAFVGFGITGSVLSKDTNSGPSGIKVELLEKSKGDQEEVVKSALTGQDGSYVFFGVLPGVYNIRVSKEAQDLYIFEKTTQVRNATLANGNICFIF